MRGGEKVLEAICDLYPDAPLFSLVHARGQVSPPIERHRIRTSFVQRLPAATRHYRQFLPLFPAAVELFDLDGFDLVISTSHCAVKSVIRPGRAVHVSYCHSPMRYAWDQFGAYFGPAQVGATRSRLLRPVMAALARWDRATAGRVDSYVANSRYVAERIRRYYNRESTVVYPPVDTAFYRPDDDRHATRSGFLVVSALVPYKRLDVAIDACRRLAAPLTIVGTGPERAGCRPWPARTSRFWDGDRTRTSASCTGSPPRRSCPASRTSGWCRSRHRPAAARSWRSGSGGAAETVVDGETGVLVVDPSVEAFADGLSRVRALAFDGGIASRTRPAVLARALPDRFSGGGRRRRRTTVQAPIARPGGCRSGLRLGHRPHARGPTMMRRYNRLLVAFYVVTDALLGMAAFVIAYLLRFETWFADFVPVTKGQPPFGQYVNVLPLLGVLVPLAFHVQGLYRLRRGRTRVDDFFAVFVGSILAVVLGLIGTLYYQVYHAPQLSPTRRRRASTRSPGRSGCSSSSVNVILTYTSRELVREALERRWRAGIGLKRVLIAGAGDLGRLVADKLLEHRELGFKVIGFLDDRAAGDHIGYRGLPLLGTLAEGGEIIRQERIDHLYVALAARRARQDARAGRRDQPRGRRRPRRSRPPPVHRAARAPREPRRRSDHQPQRRAAARLQQPAQAHDRRRHLGRGPWSARHPAARSSRR